jgi:ribonuclease HIII
LSRINVALSTFVATLDLKLAPKLKRDLEAQGFAFSQPPYTLFAAKKAGISCALYQSGKLTVQGKEMGAFIEFYLEPELLGSFEYTQALAKVPGVAEVPAMARIGIDESGKGDFFGPLCIAGVYAPGEQLPELKAWGVCDSKNLEDKKALQLAGVIKKNCAHCIVRINPAKYNELYEKFKNLNSLLAWGHATAIEQLVEQTKCRNVIVDQFAAEHVVLTALKRKQLDVTLTQRHRAEEDLVVAAASILARAAFLEGLEMLSKEFALKLPKGASRTTIQAGRTLVAQHGRDALGKAAKLHFKTTQAVL